MPFVIDENATYRKKNILPIANSNIDVLRDIFRSVV